MIEPGREWQARKIAECAEVLASEWRVHNPLSLSTTYAQGVADVLHYALGELFDGETPTELTRILDRFYAETGGE